MPFSKLIALCFVSLATSPDFHLLSLVLSLFPFADIVQLKAKMSSFKQCNQYDIADNRGTQFSFVGLVLSLLLSRRTAPANARRLEGAEAELSLQHGIA